MGFFTWYSRRRALKRYARQLPTALRTRYGAAPEYTPAQVLATVESLGLSKKHILFAYACFLSESSFATLGVDLATRGKYQDFKDAILPFLNQPGSPVQLDNSAFVAEDDFKDPHHVV
jgi:hypothetical protein